MTDWRIAHGNTIHSFLTYLNGKSADFILKGGTALMTCYELDRFSEDIDLDGRNPNIEGIVKGFCDTSGYTYRVAKDTDTVKRYMIHYGNIGKPLKVEVSYRKKCISEDETARINGILVYGIDSLCIMKINAYEHRDKIRDLYDLSFICNHYYDDLHPQTVKLLQSAVEYKGLEQFDYIIRTQQDELIDGEKLAEDFLMMFDRLELLCSTEERRLIEDLKTDCGDMTATQSDHDEPTLGGMKMKGL